MEIEQQRSSTEQASTSEQQGATAAGQAGDVAGLIRRVRRLAKLSQRDLAQELGVSQSAVAKWETGRTTPGARMMVRVLELAELELAAVRRDGERVRPMREVAARDAAGRRYPAHTYVWAQGWWAPEGSETTAWYSDILARSDDLDLPRVRYSTWWQLGRRPTLADVADHPTWEELVAEAREGWRPPRRNVLPIPEWAYADSRKSRNRRPESFPILPHEIRLGRGTGPFWRAPAETRGGTDAPRQ